MSRKSVYDRIAEAQKKGVFEGTMAAQGKNIRWFNDEWFETNSLEEITKTLNQDEYTYYREKVNSVQTKEGNEMYEKERNRINESLSKNQEHFEHYVKLCIDKQARFPQPNRVPEDKIRQDIKHLVGNPMTGDYSYLEKLKEYAGEIEQGNSPDVKLGE
ncbi:MAG: hypothetical protein RBS43_08730 [Candidatus Cloacimonas sp.]|jgi:hypothetical protein|nr:hypothetical protein [Candidatus Cloacimonas sp.]